MTQSLQMARPITQQYEHLLFGSVTEANLQALLHRLRGLCDGATEGGIEFCDREITYKIGPYITRNRWPGRRCIYLQRFEFLRGSWCWHIQSSCSPVPWCTRRTMVCMKFISHPLHKTANLCVCVCVCVCRYLIYSGQVEPGDSHKLTAVRTCVHTACSHTLMDILKELRFELGFVAHVRTHAYTRAHKWTIHTCTWAIYSRPLAEVILKGFLFKKGIMKIAVFKLFQVLNVWWWCV